MTSKENYLKLLSIITHNVKGPIKYMQFITDYTLRNWDKMQPQDLLDCASVINDSARNISNHLDNLMNWARLQDGSFRPQKKHFSLYNAFEDELKVQRPILRLKKVAIHVNFARKTQVNSDENLLKLAFHNLLTNAIKFTKKGDSISISVDENEEGQTILITDTGIGMTAEELNMLKNNQAFTKLGTVHEQGSGFGVQITQLLAELLNGKLDFESESKKGTTVKLFLPH